MRFSPILLGALGLAACSGATSIELVPDAGSAADDAGSWSAPNGNAADSGASAEGGGAWSDASSADAASAGDAEHAIDGATDGAIAADAATEYDANTPSVCTSGRTSTSGTEPPGTACVACHKAQGTGITWSVAGTVYPTWHEPDKCIGVAGATVTFAGAQGVVGSVVTNANGNFHFNDLPTQYTATISFGGKSRTSTTPHTGGDCDGCHTETGAQGAPGRLTF